MTEHLLTVVGAFVRAHTADAARVLQARPLDDLVALLTAVPDDLAAVLLAQMETHSAARALERIPPARTAEVIGSVPPGRAVALMRGMAQEARRQVLLALPPDRRDHLEYLLSYRADTVGAHMDPRVLTVPPETTASDAIALVRADPVHAAHVLYAVDRQRRLAGVVSLKELLASSASVPVAVLMASEVVSLRVRDSLSSVYVDPAWTKYRMLPVLDERGLFAGVLRHSPQHEEQDTANRSGNPSDHAAEALGDLYRIGLTALFNGAVGGRQRAPHVGGTDGRRGQRGRPRAARGGGGSDE